MTPKERFLAASRNEDVDFTPVWFMRQAGRYLPGYREIRKKFSVVEICKSPAVCEQATVMPVRELGVDAAVMFADIMLPLEGMGVDFKIEEDLGPVLPRPIRGKEDVERLGKFDARSHVPYVLEAISRVRKRLDESNHALIGFSGAPFTIASYLIEGQPSRDFAKTKRLMFDEPETWASLMSKLTDMVCDYLGAQIKSGVDAVQLFDSWVGALSARDYDASVSPFVKRIFDTVGSDFPETPKIHFGINTLHLLRAMKEKTGGDVFSVDWRIPLGVARSILETGTAVQGNLDPAFLLSRDQNGFIRERVQTVLDENNGRLGHIFNLGHGVLRDTPVENVRFVVDYVHNHS